MPLGEAVGIAGLLQGALSNKRRFQGELLLEFTKAANCAEQEYYTKYGEQFGDCSNSFLARSDNARILEACMLPTSRWPRAADLDLNGFGGAPTATPEAAAYFLGKLREEMRRVPILDSIVGQQHVVETLRDPKAALVPSTPLVGREWSGNQAGEVIDERGGDRQLHHGDTATPEHVEQSAEPWWDYILFLQTLATESRTRGDKARLAGILFQIGSTLIEHRGYILAEGCLRDALNAQQSLSADNALAALNYALGHALFGQCKFAEACDHFTDGVRHADAHGRQADVALLLISRAKAELEMGSKDAANTTLGSALQAASMCNDKQAVAPVWAQLGNVHLESERFDKAERCFESAIAAYSPESRGRAIATYDLGRAYLNMGRTRDAVARLSEARRVASLIGDLRGEGLALDFLGIANAASNDLHAAQKCWSEALERKRTMGDLEGAVVNLNRLGQIAVELDNMESGAALLMDAQKTAEPLRNQIAWARREYANALVHNAYLKQRQGDTLAAFDLYTASLAARDFSGTDVPLEATELTLTRMLMLADEHCTETTAKDVLHAALDIALRANSPELAAGTCTIIRRRIASVHNNAELPTLRAKAEDLLERWVASEDPGLRRRALHELGSHAMAEDDLRSAVGHLTAALSEAESVSDTRGAAMAHHQLGVLAAKQEDHRLAAEHLAQARTLKANGAPLRSRVATDREFAVALSAQGRFADAENAIARALKLRAQLAPHDQVELLTTAVRLAWEGNRESSTSRCLEAILGSASPSHDLAALAQAQLWLGRYHLKHGRPLPALKYFELAEQKYAQIGDTKYVLNTIHEIGKAARVATNMELAIASFERGKQINDAQKAPALPPLFELELGRLQVDLKEDFPAGRQYLREARVRASCWGPNWRAPLEVTRYLAIAEFNCGETAVAKALVQEALDCAREHDVAELVTEFAGYMDEIDKAEKTTNQAEVEGS